MSEKHLYEKHLAEKLQQLSPPPDVDGNWQKMKALLDDDSPRGGAFKRWWRLGALAGLLLIGGWIAVTQLQSTSKDQNQVATAKPGPANVEEKKSSPGNTSPASDEKSTAIANGTAPSSSSSSSFSENERKLPDADKKTVAVETNDDAAATVEIKPGNNKPAIINVDIGSEQKLARNNSAKKNKKQTTNNTRAKDDITVLKDRKKNTDFKDNTDYTDKAVAKDMADAKVQRTAELSPVDDNTNYTGSIRLAPADSLNEDLASLSANVKEVVKLTSKSARAAKKRSERSFAFGFSLPLAFPLGDQKALSYNFNAGANTVSDYIPSPHVQYKLNNKTYLQTELQFISPQYIRPILLYENRSLIQGGSYMQYNSVYARKLYYFNLPIGIHHSPFPNFYMGTGLQFSSLLSGVGLYEQTKRSLNGQPVSLMHEHYGRLGGDSLSSRMNRAEVRLMLEMNYYVNRFTFGLRYNQAFNNYVDFRLDNMSPYTFDKNKALQFYLRYNLWEDIRRKMNAKNLLSSK